MQIIDNYSIKNLALYLFFFGSLFLSGWAQSPPPGVSQPPQFAKRPWETQPQARGLPEPTARSQHQKQPVMGRPLNHIPQIRNPKLRQYYLQGTPAGFHHPDRERDVCIHSASCGMNSSLYFHFIILTLSL